MFKFSAQNDYVSKFIWHIPSYNGKYIYEFEDEHVALFTTSWWHDQEFAVQWYRQVSITRVNFIKCPTAIILVCDVLTDKKTTQTALKSWKIRAGTKNFTTHCESPITLSLDTLPHWSQPHTVPLSMRNLHWYVLEFADIGRSIAVNGA